MIYKKLISSMLIYSIVLFSFSCGIAETPSETTAENTTNDSLETKPEYDYPEADYQGHELIILNQDKCNWANRLTAPEETNGDLINDAMFERNMRVEERYNIKIKEITISRDEIATMTKNAVNAGDDIYDIVMCPIDVIGGLLLDGYFNELTGITSLNLEEPWWDQAVIKAATLGGAEILGMEDYGRVQDNYIADLIAVRGDPCEFPYLLSSVNFVMKDGVVIKNV
jgi:maltose-binding protein MalE